MGDTRPEPCTASATGAAAAECSDMVERCVKYLLARSKAEEASTSSAEGAAAPDDDSITAVCVGAPFPALSASTRPDDVIATSLRSHATARLRDTGRRTLGGTPWGLEIVVIPEFVAEATAEVE